MKKILPLVFLALIIFGAYAPTLRNGFVWDDSALIQRDPLILSPRLIPEGFQHFLFTDATASDFYRPMQRLSYTIDYAAFGFRAARFHLMNIVWHLAAAIALFFFAAVILALFEVNERISRVIALVATAVWAIHPLHTSVVAYISGRADALAAAFGFAALSLAIRGLRGNRVALWGCSVITGALMLLSALSKEIGLVFLALWLAILLLRRNWRALRPAIAAVAFVLVSYWSLRAPAEHIAPPTRPPLPALVRPILCARAFAEYTGLILLPLNLHMERDVETRPTGFNPPSVTAASWRELQTLAGLLLFAAFLYWLIRKRRRDPAVFALLILTVIAYLPISGIYGLNASVAEHWLYLPTAFFFLACALAAVRLLQSETRVTWLRPLAISATVMWALFLDGRTFTRTFDWKDQRTFLERTIAAGGDSPRMLINLAGSEMQQDRLDEAKQHLLAALKKDPEQPLAVLNLAAVAVKQNDFAAAHKLLARAREIPQITAQAYELMTILENKETGRANLLRLRLASRSGPPNWGIEKRYVRWLDESGHRAAAIDELRGCLTTQWYRADSWQLLGVLLAKSGRGPEAAEAFERAHLYDIHLGESPTS